jgi:ribosomal protein S6E (S10)
MATHSPLETDDTFYAGALKRTGTLLGDAREGLSKGTATISENASFGLKRSGTILQNAKVNAWESLQKSGTVLGSARQGLLKRSGTLSQSAWEGLQKTGTYFEPAKEGAAKRKGSWTQWASSYTKSYYNPDRPIKASFREIAGVTLPRTNHSLSVINGRAYIFGGDLPSGNLANNDMHLVILPSSSVLEADYKSIPARPQTRDGPVPAPRKGHTAVVVENEIYIFGGQTASKSPEEIGRVWVYDVISAKWSFHDPKADAPYPPSRYLHSAVSSDEPGPAHPSENTVDLREQEIDASKTVPIPPASDSWGTMFIYGGKSMDGETTLNDVWGFDISARVWFPLPPAPSPARLGASFVLADDILYRVGGEIEDGKVPRVDFLEVGGLLKVRERGEAFYKVALPALLREWTTAPLTAPVNAPVIRQVDSGTGKKLLLPISAGTKTLSAIDVTPSGNTRLAGVDFPEQSSDPKTVIDVAVQYLDLYEEVLSEEESARHAFKAVEGFAVSAGTEVEAANLVIWGGKDETGKPLNKGYLVTIGS